MCNASLWMWANYVVCDDVQQTIIPSCTLDSVPKIPQILKDLEQNMNRISLYFRTESIARIVYGTFGLVALIYVFLLGIVSFAKEVNLTSKIFRKNQFFQ